MSYDLAAINPNNEFLGNMIITLAASILVSNDFEQKMAIRLAFDLYDGVLEEGERREAARKEKRKAEKKRTT